MPKQRIKVKHAGMSDVVPASKQAHSSQETPIPKKRGKFFWTCGALLVVFVCLVVVYFVVAQNLAHKYLMEGNEKFNAHLYTEAKRDFVFASALSFFGKQTDADALRGQGIVADLKGDHEGAAINFHEALQKKSSDSLVQQYAEQLFVLQKYSEVVAELSKIQNPSDETLYLSAHAELRQDNFESAKKSIEALSDKDVNGIAKNEHLAYFALRDHNNDFLTLYPKTSDQKFFAAAEKALKSKSYSAVDFVTLGNFLVQNGEEDFALDFANKALDLENNYRDAIILRAQSFAARKQYKEAEESLTKAFTLSLLNKDIWYLQAQVEAAQGNMSDAIVSYKKANELGQDSALFHFSYAKVARKGNDYETAVAETQKGLRLDSENGRVYLQFIFWTSLDAQNFTQMQDVAKQYGTKYPNEEFGKLATALADYKLQKISNFSAALADADATSAFAKYLEAIDSMDQHMNFDKDATKKLLEQAIDFDTNTGSNSEIATHAAELMKNL